MFEVVTEIARHLEGWRCDIRGTWPRLLGPNGAQITTRMERGNRIIFYAPPPTGPDDRHRSWQGWEVTPAQWSNYSISCSTERPAQAIAKDLSRRLIAKLVVFWPQALAKKRREIESLETLQHVTNLFLKVVEGASVITWNSCLHRKNIHFQDGSCEVYHYGRKASLKFSELSYTDALKMAGFYQQLLNEKVHQNGEGSKEN